jgi:protein TonB
MARTALARRAEPTLGATVVAFPASRVAPAPVPRQRPLLPAPTSNRAFQVALVLSVVVHAGLLIGLEARRQADLARAAGSAVPPVVEGAADVIEVEIVAQAALPSAPTPTNATEVEAKTPSPAPEPPAAEPERQDPIPAPEPAPAPPEPERAEVPPAPIEAPVEAAAEDDAVKLSVVEPKPETPAEPATPTSVTPIVGRPDPREQEEPKQDTSRDARTVVDRARTRSAPSAPSVAASPARRAAARAPGPGGSLGQIDIGGAALISSYQARVLAHLSRFRTFPPEARSRGITGMAAVRFALAPNGRVLAASLARRSGAAILDAAALAMVRRASPFPPFPAGLKRSRLEFAAPVRFDLR